MNRIQILTEGLSHLGLDEAQVEAISAIAAVLFEGAADLTYFRSGPPMPTDSLYTSNRNVVNRLMNLDLLRKAGIQVPSDKIEQSNLIRENLGKYGVQKMHSTPELKEWVAANSHTTIDGAVMDEFKRQKDEAARENEDRELVKKNNMGGDAIGSSVAEFDSDTELSGPHGHSGDDSSDLKQSGYDQMKKSGLINNEDYNPDTLGDDEDTKDLKRPMNAINEIDNLTANVASELSKIAPEFGAFPALYKMLFGEGAGSVQSSTFNSGFITRFLSGDETLLAEFNKRDTEYGVTKEDILTAGDALDSIVNILGGGQNGDGFYDKYESAVLNGIIEAGSLSETDPNYPTSIPAAAVNPKTNRIKKFTENELAKAISFCKLPLPFVNGFCNSFVPFIEYMAQLREEPPFNPSAAVKHTAPKNAGSKLLGQEQGARKLMAQKNRSAIERFKAMRRGLH